MAEFKISDCFLEVGEPIDARFLTVPSTRRIRDFWVACMQKSASRALSHGVDKSTVGVVGVVGRREFLRRLGAFGLMSGFAMAGWTLRFAGPAQAWGSCFGGACGPSPPCGAGCSGSNCGSYSNQPYASGQCAAGSNSCQLLDSGPLLRAEPGRWPASTSASRTHRRKVSRVIPDLSAIEAIAAHWVGCSL